MAIHSYLDAAGKYASNFVIVAMDNGCLYENWVGDADWSEVFSRQHPNSNMLLLLSLLGFHFLSSVATLTMCHDPFSLLVEFPPATTSRIASTNQ